MKILLLDNYDSFVHNLARYFRLAGCQTEIVRSDRIDAEACAAMQPSAIVISPGPKRPEEAGCSVPVVERLASVVPILGVCLGHQAIAVACGGVVSACDPLHGMASFITHQGSGLFAGCESPMKVGRYHSLAVDAERLPRDLSITARADDGVIMAIEHREFPLFGVQFHPESVLTDQGQTLVNNFVGIVASTVPL